MLDGLAQARDACLLLTAVVCVFTDLAWGKIYNIVTIAAALIGLAFAWRLDSSMQGYPHLINAMIAALTGGGILFVVYLTGGVGAGDVKLMAAIGALIGDWHSTLVVLMYTALIGAAMAIGLLIWQGKLRQGLKDGAKTLVRFKAKKDPTKAAITIPYGVAIGIAVVWAFVEKNL